MNDILFITVAGIKNNLRFNAVTIAVIITIILMVALGVAVSLGVIVIAPGMKEASPDRPAMESYLALIMYTTVFLGLGINMNVFAFQSMTREKSRGVIQSLLATPLSVKSIWVGKSLAVFLPGFILGVVVSLVAMIIVNFIYFTDIWGFLINPWMAASCFLAVPLVYIALSLLVHLVGLTGKAATGNVIVQIFLPVMITLMINLVVRSLLDAASWGFTVLHLGIAAVICIIIVLLLPRLVSERIVLSS